MSKKLLFLMCFVVMLGLAGNAMAQIDPATLTDGHVYRLGAIVDGKVPDISANSNDGNVIGDPQLVDILGGMAMQFDGVDDGVHIPDSQYINITNGPWPNRTVIVAFNCADVSKTGAQVAFQEGGTSRGFNIYVMEGMVYVGGWNKAEYQWNPGSWISAPINSNEWHAVAFVLRDGADAQEDDKFEMWMDGALIAKAPGGQMYNHSADNSIGYSTGGTLLPSGNLGGTAGYFEGIVSELWILNQALTEAELAPLMVGPQPVGEPQFLSPPDGTQIEATSQMLQWRPGELAASHNVYMGTNFDEVAAGTVPAVNTTLGMVTAGIPGGPIPEGLVPDTTYYWRVESVNDVNPESPWTSAVLSFWVAPRGAYNPQPTDGLINVVDLETDLSWTPGWNPIMHQVYFGTDPDEVANAAGAPMIVDTVYDPGPLEPGTTYYWRVDEFFGTETVKGPVWSFSTVPVIEPAEDPNLIVWWPLDEGMGRTAVDMSGYNHHGSFLGDPVWVDALAGTGLEFDGVDDQVEHLLPEATNFPNFSIALWVKAAFVGQAQYASTFSSHTPNSAGIQMDVDGSNPGVYRINPPGGTTLVFGPVVTEWVHLTLVGEGTALQFYYNGNLATTGDVTETEVQINDFVLGAARSRGAFFAGTIDDFRYYDRSLNAEEAKQLTRVDPSQAWDPQPVHLGTAHIWTPLMWQAGDGAVEHDVYLATDLAAIVAADASDTTGIYLGRQADTMIAAELAWTTKYYWRIDEVAADGSISMGHIWSFTTTDELVLYDEVTPFPYDNSADPFLSEIALDLDPAQDWTGGCGGGIGAIAISYDGMAAPGSVTEADGVYTVVGRGADIWGTSDQFQYAHTTLAGDGSMIVKVESLAATDGWTKAGIMIRESLDPGSAFAAVYATGSNGVRFQARTMANMDADSDTSVATDEQKALTPPVWLKIERTFPMISAYYSTDGVAWTPMAWNPQVIPMTPLPIHIGLAVTSHSGDSTYAEAVFSNVSSTGGVAAGPLNSAEIGLESNAAEPMYLVLEASGATSAALNPVPEATQLVGAEWIVDLDEFSIDRAAVVKATLVIGDLDNPAAGGSGMLTINSVKLLPDCVPVGYWKLDETDGTVAADSSRAGGNDGVLNGVAMSWASGKIDGALRFDGAASGTDYVEISTTGVSAAAGTIAMWSQIGPEPQAPETRYFFGHTTLPAWKNRIQLYMDGSNTMLDLGLGGSHARHTDIESLAPETWYHIALTWDGSNYAVYVNGAEMATGTYTGLDALNTVMDIGNDGNAAGRTEMFNGLIDDFRIYDVALPQAEIAKLAGM